MLETAVSLIRKSFTKQIELTRLNWQACIKYAE